MDHIRRDPILEAIVHLLSLTRHYSQLLSILNSESKNIIADRAIIFYL